MGVMCSILFYKVHIFLHPIGNQNSGVTEIKKIKIRKHDHRIVVVIV